MPARQIWLFLVERDVSALIEDLQGREPGLVTSWGRYLQGDPRDLLEDPSRLARRESLPAEARLYVLHRKHSSDAGEPREPPGPLAAGVKHSRGATQAPGGATT